jgi:hypothetical protein
MPSPPLTRAKEALPVKNFLSWITFSALLLVAASLWLPAGNRATSRPITSDFFKFYLSAERFTQGHGMYWMVPPRERAGDPCHPDTPPDLAAQAGPYRQGQQLGGAEPCLAPNLNPPVFLLLLLPLSILHYTVAWWTWSCISLLALIFGIWVASSDFCAAPRSRVTWTAWGSLAMLLWYPNLACFELGQVTLLMFPLVVAAWHFLRRGKDIQGGLWLGVAICIKPFFGLIALGLAIKGRKGAALSALVLACLMTCLGLLLFGWDNLETYISVLAKVSWRASNWNASWFGFFDRYFIGQPDTLWPENKWLSQILAVGAAMLAFGMSMQAPRPTAALEPSASADSLFMAGIPVMLLCSPLGWMYYFPWLGLSLLLAWQRSKLLMPTRTWRLILLLPVVMASIPFSLKVSPTPATPADWAGVDSWYFFTLLGLSAMCIVVSNRDAKEGGSQ